MAIIKPFKIKNFKEQNAIVELKNISKSFNIKTPVIITTGHELVYATQDLISIP